MYNMNKEQIKAHWRMLKDREKLSYRVWLHKHIDAILFLEEYFDEYLTINRIEEIYKDRNILIGFSKDKEHI